MVCKAGVSSYMLDSYMVHCLSARSIVPIFFILGE